jgi:hypothetical protein
MRASTELPNTKRIETSTSGDAWSDSLWGLSDQASCAARGWRRWPALLRGRQLFANAGLPARRTLLVLTTLLLVGLCALLAFWGGHQHADSTGIDLLADHSSRNLNDAKVLAKSAEPPLLEAPAAEPAESDSATVVPALPPIPPTIAGFDNAYTITHRGDTPMMRNWKMLGLHTFVAAVFGAAAFADDAAKPDGDSKKLDQIQTQLKKLDDVPARLSTIQTELKDLRKDFENGTALASEKLKALDQRVLALEDALKKVPDKKSDARIALSPPDPTAPVGNGDLKKISESLESIVAELKGMRTDLNTGAAGNQMQLKGLNDKIAGLERAMTAMRDQIKFYQPPPAPAPAPAPSTSDKAPVVGTIRLRNDFVNPVSVVVNGKSHRLDPGATYTMNDVPAGPFSYEVIGIQGRKLETLAAHETFTITVYTR